jgi:hypothetical protein
MPGQRLLRKVGPHHKAAARPPATKSPGVGDNRLYSATLGSSMGRYDDKETFIARLTPIIRRQLEIYRVDLAEFVSAHLQVNLRGCFVDSEACKKIGFAFLLPISLIATGEARD